MPNGMAIFRREPSNGGVECRWGRQKNAILDEYPTLLHTCLNRTSREVSKITTRGTAASIEHLPRRPSSVVRTRRRRSVCDGLAVIRQRRRSTPAATTNFTGEFSWGGNIYGTHWWLPLRGRARTPKYIKEKRTPNCVRK